jgi:hypothetical protein
MVTACAEEYVPAAGLKAGTAAGGVMVYAAELTWLAELAAAMEVPLLTWLAEFPPATAIASSISVAETVIGPLYKVELVVGVDPSVV